MLLSNLSNLISPCHFFGPAKKWQVPTIQMRWTFQGQQMWMQAKGCLDGCRDGYNGHVQDFDKAEDVWMLPCDSPCIKLHGNLTTFNSVTSSSRLVGLQSWLDINVFFAISSTAKQTTKMLISETNVQAMVLRYALISASHMFLIVRKCAAIPLWQGFIQNIA